MDFEAFDTVKKSGEFVQELSVYLCDTRVVFLIGNAIIAALFVLCRHTEAGRNSVIFESYDFEIRQGEIHPPIDSCQVYAPPRKPEKTVSSERVVRKQQSEEVLESLHMATKKIRKFRRSQSEKLKREGVLRSSRDLRRSETELSVKAVSCSGNTVEELSNEEFRLRIEKFIRKNQEFFKLQNDQRVPCVHETLRIFQTFYG